MCTFVGRGILAAWANNAQCIGMDTGRQKDCTVSTVDGGHSNLVLSRLEI